MVYLDNNATTRPDPAVLNAMLPFLSERYGNPSAGYRFGTQVSNAVAIAREKVSVLLGCDPGEIVFTSGGTESNNAAIASALQIFPERRHLVISAVEHSTTLKHCETLAKRGYEITRLRVDRQGQINLAELESAIRPDTVIVSIMTANNETGVVFPIEKIAGIVREKGVLFHTDAVQAAGKIAIDLRHFPVSYLSLSAHKLHGPKGVGALYLNRRTRFHPFLWGGNQENGRRAGTENVPGIAGFGKAAELANDFMEEATATVKSLRNPFERTVLEKISGAVVNGAQSPRLPNTSNISIPGADSEGMLMLLDQAGICCSAGSACTTGSVRPSHVLTAMGLPHELARSALRFSFSRFNTEADTAHLLAVLPGIVDRLRGTRNRAEASSG